MSLALPGPVTAAEQGGFFILGVCHAFRLSCIPPRTSHHAKRIVKHGRFSTLADSAPLVAAKVSLRELLVRHQPAEPIRGPVVLSVTWVWPWTQGHGRALRKRGHVVHSRKPDLSNVLKTLEDRLVELGFIEDDAAVVDLRCRKFWGDVPGIAITIQSYAFASTQGAPNASPTAPRPAAPARPPTATPRPGQFGGPEPPLEPEPD